LSPSTSWREIWRSSTSSIYFFFFFSFFLLAPYVGDSWDWPRGSCFGTGVFIHLLFPPPSLELFHRDLKTAKYRVHPPFFPPFSLLSSSPRGRVGRFNFLFFFFLFPLFVSFDTMMDRPCVSRHSAYVVAVLFPFFFSFFPFSPSLLFLCFMEGGPRGSLPFSFEKMAVRSVLHSPFFSPFFFLLIQEMFWLRRKEIGYPTFSLLPFFFSPLPKIVPIFSELFFHSLPTFVGFFFPFFLSPPCTQGAGRKLTKRPFLPPPFFSFIAARASVNKTSAESLPPPPSFFLFFFSPLGGE